MARAYICLSHVWEAKSIMQRGGYVPFRAIHAKALYVALPCLSSGINEPLGVGTLLRVVFGGGFT